MKSKRNTRATVNQVGTANQVDEQVFLEECVLWLGLGVILFSVTVPLLAMRSYIVADSLARFSPLHQFVAFVLVLAALGSFGMQLLASGWRLQRMIAIVGSLMILLCLQPAAGCCNLLIAYLSGFGPEVELHASDVVLHLMPVVGSGLLVADVWWNRRERRRNKFSQQ